MHHRQWHPLWRLGLARLILILALSSIASADTDECPPGCDACALKRQVNALIPGVTWGADLRLRSEFLDNSKLDRHMDAADVWRQRFRGRVWMEAQPTDTVTLAGRLTTEPYYFTQPDDLDEQFTRDEAIIDQLYVDWKGTGQGPFRMRLGRQDIRLGDGWLLRRGTPLDSSRTNFFDAIRTTLTLDNSNSDLDLIYLRNHSNSSWLARPFNDADLDLSEDDTAGVIAYARNRRVPNTELDAYFIYKHNDPVPANDLEADIYTFGIRVAGTVHSVWKYSTELAPQFGRRNETDLDTLGAKALLSYFLQDTWDSHLRAGYEYRSGDRNPDGAFDILWGRHGENPANIFGSIAALEGQSCHLSNVHRFQIGWTGHPSERLCLAGDYGPLFSDAHPFAGTAGFSDDGRFRGHLITGSASYRINCHASLRLLGETFCPGNYYEAPCDDTATFLRSEIMLVC